MQAKTGLIFQTEFAIKWSFQPSPPLIVFFYWPESHPSNSTALHSGVIHIWVCLSSENLINFRPLDWASFLISATEFIFLELRSEMCARNSWEIKSAPLKLLWANSILSKILSQEANLSYNAFLSRVLMACLMRNAGVRAWSSVVSTQKSFPFLNHVVKTWYEKLVNERWLAPKLTDLNFLWSVA